MASLLNKSRPPVFCPGCSHDQVAKALDQAFQDLGLAGNEICLVSDIGCSGLFDTFFHTHAFHGLHGRALTYASGIKLCQPDLTVVVTMGDGGLGIGGAHLLSACRRNLDLTLLVLNNFNFGMTGGQCSATTPVEAVVGSGFLNQLEKPMELGAVAVAAGAPYVVRASVYQKGLTEVIAAAIRYQGLSIVEIQGLCPGRYTKRNKMTPKSIEENLATMEPLTGPIAVNLRPEYGQAYRETAARQKPEALPAGIVPECLAPEPGRRDVIILGSAGQRVVTAGEILGMAGLYAGLKVSQKNEYDITVLRGPSITELILSPEEIDYLVIKRPGVILALAPEGVSRRKDLFQTATEDTLVVQATGVELPETKAQVVSVDFKARGLRSEDWSLAGLAVMAQLNKTITMAMLDVALTNRFKGDTLAAARTVVAKATGN